MPPNDLRPCQGTISFSYSLYFFDKLFNNQFSSQIPANLTAGKYTILFRADAKDQGASFVSCSDVAIEIQGTHSLATFVFVYN